MMTAGIDIHLDELPDDHVLVTVAGDVDVTTVARLREALHVLYEKRLQRLVLDLSAVTTADVTLLATLVAARRAAASRGCSLVLRAPSRPVSGLLTGASLTSVFRIVPACPPLAVRV
ncbi:MAG TPA: STAS domain-containing protein [Mycobacteriales bacterium]|nr:STAS domain-containing protein [Mycobacteriales bacterium]